jgi:DNA invertase Pin-like site-specific DNA recombinase
MRVAGYVRVSSREQGATGLGLQAQKEALSAAAAHRDGWQLATVAVEIASAGNVRRRPVLTSLLDDLDAGRYGVLVVSRLDRLARSVGDFATTLDRAKRNGWELVCLDPAVDMTTPYGKAMAGVAAVFAELERELISQRTKEGLAVAIASGRMRARNLEQEYGDRAVIDRIVRLHQPAAFVFAERDPGDPGGRGCPDTPQGWPVDVDAGPQDPEARGGALGRQVPLCPWAAAGGPQPKVRQHPMSNAALHADRAAKDWPLALAALRGRRRRCLPGPAGRSSP